MVIDNSIIVEYKLKRGTSIEFRMNKQQETEWIFKCVYGNVKIDAATAAALVGVNGKGKWFTE